jgi:hypothetical protein
VRALGADTGRAARIHPALLARLLEEGGIATAQHLAGLKPARRTAQLVAGVRADGVAVPDEMLAHIAPLGWEHISLTGDYDWVAAAPRLAASGLCTKFPPRSCSAPLSVQFRAKRAVTP